MRGLRCERLPASDSRCSEEPAAHATWFCRTNTAGSSNRSRASIIRKAAIMSLMKCPECASDVSDRASSCPHCGYPVHEVVHNMAVQRQFDALLQETLERDGKIAAILLYGKQHPKAGLAEAKECVERLEIHQLQSAAGACHQQHGGFSPMACVCPHCGVEICYARRDCGTVGLCPACSGEFSYPAHENCTSLANTSAEAAAVPIDVEVVSPVTEPEEPVEDMLRCPQCGSTHLHSDRQGASLGKAVAGSLLVGPIGLVAALHGANRIRLTCLKCGHNFQPGR